MLEVSFIGSTEIYYPNYDATATTNSDASLKEHIQKCSVTKGIMIVDYGMIGSIVQTVGTVNGVVIASNTNVDKNLQTPKSSSQKAKGFGFIMFLALYCTF